MSANPAQSNPPTVATEHSLAPSAGYADCPECGDKERDDGYSCERCDVQVTICNNCHTILEECGCGLCKKGLTFYESA